MQSTELIIVTKFKAIKLTNIEKMVKGKLWLAYSSYEIM